MNLRLYQIMVEAYQDGDPTRDFGNGYGPSDHKGDLRGIINALDYIKSLGINAIWLTPIFQSNGTTQIDATGYYGQDYFKIDKNFGTLDDARELVDKAHKLGLYVFFDGVFGHHGLFVEKSPQGRTPVQLKPIGGLGYQLDYSKEQTLDFYKEVATYWIDTLGIDGWRLDQAYQVPVKSWESLRIAVETASEARKNRGEKWGILGYMVGEIWDSETNICTKGYGNQANGLPSNFDFPLRYAMVQVFATQEDTKPSYASQRSVEALNEGYRTREKYPSTALPNLMITNHDLVRFGDLIQRAPRLNYGPENPAYWNRHKMILSFLASVSGPITLYYGDEYGAEVPGYVKNRDRGFYDDHVSRDNGRVKDFSPQETDLIAYTAKLFSLRENHPALFKGNRTNLLAKDTSYADLKVFDTDKILYVLNISTDPATITLNSASLGDAPLTEISVDGPAVNKTGNDFIFNLPALSSRIYLIP